MILNILSNFTDLSFLSRFLIVAIVSGFMPLTAMSFFWFMRQKKQQDFEKNLREMGISSSRRVQDTYSFSNYFLPVGFAFLICLLASAFFVFTEDFAANLKDSLLLTGNDYGSPDNSVIINQSLVVLGFAFFGSFIWSAQQIIRRLIAYDLSPSVYYSAGVRIILACLVALVFSFLLGKTSMFELDTSIAVIAFLTGMFPQRILSSMINFYKDWLNPDELNTDTLSLYKIEGMSLGHKERLEEVGIDNAQNLATASLTKLLIETPYEARQILDWIGQAKLVCYAKNDIDKLRSVGIRSIFDFKKGNKSRVALREISDSIGIVSPLLEVIAEQVEADKGIDNLYKFHVNVDDPNQDIPFEELNTDSDEGAVG
jgi:hypothetical protein